MEDAPGVLTGLEFSGAFDDLDLEVSFSDGVACDFNVLAFRRTFHDLRGFRFFRDDLEACSGLRSFECGSCGRKWENRVDAVADGGFASRGGIFGSLCSYGAILGCGHPFKPDCCGFDGAIGFRGSILAEEFEMELFGEFLAGWKEFEVFVECFPGAPSIFDVFSEDVIFLE